MKRNESPSSAGSAAFRFEDSETGIGHAIAFPQAVAPRFAIRREIEGDYVLPAPVGGAIAEAPPGGRTNMDEDGPLHVWHELDEAALREWAAQYVGWATSEMSDPADLAWTLDHAMPLDLVSDVGTDWDAYYLDEIEEGVRYDSDFADAEYHTPVVVSIEDGQTIIWDGWHRLACAIRRGDRGIMAIVGRQPGVPHAS